MEPMLSQVFTSVNSVLSDKQQLYLTGLIATEEKKTFCGISRIMGTSHDLISRCLDAEIVQENLQEVLLSLVHMLSENPGQLIGDDTVLIRFSKKMEGVSQMFSSLEEKVVDGQCPVVLAWSNGEVTIPIAWDLWLPENLVNEQYRTKQGIMRALILQVKDHLPNNVDLSIFDGLYQSEEMMTFLDENNLRFGMRCPKNRKVQLEKDGLEIKIKNHPGLKLKKNTRRKIFQICIKGKLRYLLAEREKNSAGEFVTTYTIFNFELNDPKEYSRIYSLRWPIEQVFRTGKQSTGLGDCQAKAKKSHSLGFACFRYGRYNQVFMQIVYHW